MTYRGHTSVFPINFSSRIIRIGEALTIHIGKASLLHLDFMNNPLQLFDNISWVVNIVDDFRLYLTPASIKKCQLNDVPLNNVPMTFLAYMRSILGSQALKMKGIANESCPLFQMYATQVSFDFKTDTERLDNKEFWTRFLALANKKRMGVQRLLKTKASKEDYKGSYCLVQENNNRHIFLGSFVYVWDRFLSKYLGKVLYEHLIQFVAFVSRECNGVALCVDMILDLVIRSETMEQTCHALSQPSPALFEFLEIEYQARRESVPISSSSPQWQNVDPPIYTDSQDRWKSTIHVGFVQRIFDKINKADKSGGVRWSGIVGGGL
jgi:hypothetical protein